MEKGNITTDKNEIQKIEHTLKSYIPLKSKF